MNPKGFSQMKEASATIYQAHPLPSSTQDEVDGGKDSSAPAHSPGGSSCQTNTASVRLELKALHCRGSGGRAPVEHLPPTCSGAASSSCNSVTRLDRDVRQL